MLTFLEINGIGVSVTDRELADWIIGLGAGMPAETLAAVLRSRLTGAS